MRDFPGPAASSAPQPAGGGRTLVILLAGGKGTRLHELTQEDCKPAVFFAGRRRIADFALANALRSGCGQMLVASQYRPASLHRHLEQVWAPAFAARGGALTVACGTEVTGRDEGYIGTADAVTQNIAAIDAAAPDRVLVLAADHVYHADFGAMLAAHACAAAPVTVAAHVVPRSQASGFGVIGVSPSGRALSFVEKPADPPGMPGDPAYALASMGIYVFDWPWLRERLIEDAADAGSGHDFGSDILPAAVLHGDVNVWRFAGPGGSRPYWRDVGTLDAYRVAQLDFAGAQPPCALPDLPPLTQGVAGFVPIALRRADRRDPSRALLTETVVMPGATISPGARLSRAIVAPGAQVPAWLVVGEDPAEDARWFRRTPGGTVLITQAMLARRESLAPPSLAAWSRPVRGVAKVGSR
ncbi:sugar phosphate nucleotidyltransferase [Frigidibacter oleivorans]|uniref:sugar phosphate nucleotidyltransferase n=1 Tax=Frigidibacter oleivorans TaxID=2487129 RepID=UPI000F8DFA82|nr:sugar phosphate nucleotidyltransferase [Frigidibacter oleivorans]